MSQRMLPGRRGVALLAVTIMAVVVALGAAYREAAPSAAQGQPAMALEANGCRSDCRFGSTETFTLRVVATQVPQGGYAGMQTGIFPGGLTYNQRACEEEVKMEPRALCLGPTVAAAGQVVHGGTTGVAPLPLATTMSTNLVEISMTCTSGSHEVLLSAYPSDSLGAQFTDENGETFEVATVGTRSLDLGLGNPPEDVDIASALTVNCGAGGQPSGTSQPGGTAGPVVTLSPPEATAAQAATATQAAQATRAAQATAEALGTPSGTGTPANGAGDDDDGGGLGAGVWAVIIIAIVAGAATAGGGGWWYWRRRQGGTTAE